MFSSSTAVDAIVVTVELVTVDVLVTEVVVAAVLTVGLTTGFAATPGARMERQDFL